MSALCPFCNRKEFDDRIISEGQALWTIASRGQIVPGYALLLPKRHALCLGDLDEHEMSELILAKERLREACLLEYGAAPVFFEHGIVGQSVRHAHLHAVPAALDLRMAIAADYPDPVPLRTICELRRVFQTHGPYLYFEDGHGNKTAFPVFRRPQYLRRLLAEAVGDPARADWQHVDPALDHVAFLETRRRLASRM